MTTKERYEKYELIPQHARDNKWDEFVRDMLFLIKDDGASTYLNGGESYVEFFIREIKKYEIHKEDSTPSLPTYQECLDGAVKEEGPTESTKPFTLEMIQWDNKKIESFCIALADILTHLDRDQHPFFFVYVIQFISDTLGSIKVLQDRKIEAELDRDDAVTRYVKLCKFTSQLISNNKPLNGFVCYLDQYYKAAGGASDELFKKLANEEDVLKFFFLDYYEDYFHLFIGSYLLSYIAKSKDIEKLEYCKKLLIERKEKTNSEEFNRFLEHLCSSFINEIDMQKEDIKNNNHSIKQGLFEISDFFHEDIVKNNIELCNLLLDLMVGPTKAKVKNELKNTIKKLERNLSKHSVNIKLLI